jgi:hypothetical protein
VTSPQPDLSAQDAHLAGADPLDHARVLLRDGVVLLADVIDPALLRACADHLASEGGIAALGEGARWTNPDRFYVPVPIDGPLAEASVVANTVICDVARAVLGGDCVLDSFGVIVSLPGAAAQDVHVDGVLFPGSPCNRIIPPFALTVSIPLVPVDESNGSTGFYIGSHHHARHDGEPDFVPDIPLGSALVWDYRVRHRGEANPSGHPRPVLFAVYCRSWWQDSINYKHGAVRKISLSAAAASALLPDYETMLARADLSHANTGTPSQ